MNKPSFIELQKIDCNCNECIFMERNFISFNKWSLFHKDLQQKDFKRKRELAFKIANECLDAKGKETLLKAANKMVFQFDSRSLISYGNCLKFTKPVSFMVGICQIDTQKCFKHRREN